MNSGSICSLQPRNKISYIRANDVSVPSPCTHQALKTFRDWNSIRAEVEEVVRDKDMFSA